MRRLIWGFAGRTYYIVGNLMHWLTWFQSSVGVVIPQFVTCITAENLIMSLRNDIVSFWFWGYRGDIRIELQAPLVIQTKESEYLKPWNHSIFQDTVRYYNFIYTYAMTTLNRHDCRIAYVISNLIFTWPYQIFIWLRYAFHYFLV